MKFSVLIANYNNGHFFNDCFLSIVGQTYEHWEAIIVDDGSTDNSVEEIERIIKGDNRFKFSKTTQTTAVGIPSENVWTQLPAISAAF